MKSLLLKNGDICINSNNNIAVAGYELSVAQNVSTAIKLFTNDAYFNTELGLPHFDITLKKNPDLAVIRSRIIEVAASVDGVKKASAELTFDSLDNTLKGVIYLTLKNNKNAEVSIML